MDATNPTPKPARKSSYNPYKRRRCVRRDQEASTQELTAFVTKSFTRDDDDTRYHPTVDVHARTVFCDCPHFSYKIKSGRLNDPATHCKHLQRAVGNMERNGELAPLADRQAQELEQRKAAYAGIAIDWD